ncbi:restriction endonuclease subunit S [Uruburuella suis]|uniref:Restriction endonuclease subunit S n=1 Tax=Uruburuella suis TaxID=252130 RepID=A0AAE9GUG2_9NEIS|nr:restriction endonuclease subunit S [Uruburuella suis]TCP06869.1 type I restriction enzyme S subunit [Uruburuella suis]UOO80195.1 restriction endonuclease subunit S [Uruburuella suis]
MEFKQYPSYKNSGVEWLGGVPEHWVGSKFKYIFQEKQHTKNMNLPFGAISFGSVVYKEDKANLTDELKENYQEVLQGEFLVNPLNLNYDLKSLRTALSKIDVVVSSGYFVLKLKNNTFNKRYLEYLLYIFDIRKMKTLGAGIRQTLTFRDMAVCDVAIPSACEQTQIASFLDYETFRIDNLIAKQEKLIELLEEQRKSIISHAVTKGLNPNAPMKDSGVEWLGEVPEHWQQKPIWSLFKRIKRTNFPTERLLSVYRDYGVIPKDSRDDNHNRASEDLTPYQLVCANDLVINKMKAWQGSIAISELRGIVSPAYYIYQPKAEYHSKYIHFLIRSAYYIQSYKNYSKGIRVNQWDLESEAFTHIDLLLPSLDEQQKIVAFLDTETARIDNLISKQKSLIEKLKEYRTSIISHAVTGKIDVREFGA